jgi:hypothetical protein
MTSIYQTNLNTTYVTPSSTSYANPNYIISQFKITRNPTWQFINVGDRQSPLTIIANTFSLIALAITITSLILNFLTKRFMRKLYYRILPSCCISKPDTSKHLEQISYVASNEKVNLKPELENKESIELVINPVQRDSPPSTTILHSHKNSSHELILDENGMQRFRSSVAESYHSGNVV